uniref:Vacuolar ATPase assembly protein VMA22 n=1 Tax=Opuntia streptacantha TaxID=393608 RepID=A0A7C9CQ14_OPUST
MSDLGEIESSEVLKQSQMNETDNQSQSVTDEDVLKFMDSLDAYLCLLHSLSSTLRQGWFDFASARYSMGASRVNSALLDLKEHPAATYLEVRKAQEPHFTLCKWSSFGTGDSSEMQDGDVLLPESDSSIHQRHKDTSKASVKDNNSPVGVPATTADDRVRKERSKSLAVFGTLVSPKLRAAQLSFEGALETLVEIANARASMVSAFDKVREHKAGSKD